MDNEIQRFNFENKGITTITVENNPYFVGSEVTNILGYVNSSKAIIDHVDEEDRKTLSYKDYNESLKPLWKDGDFTNKTLIN